MNPGEYERMYSLEDRYWWFVGRRFLALRLLKKYAPEGRILDIGCGTGVVLGELPESAVGLDMSPLALEFSAKRGLRQLIQGDGEALPFGDAVFKSMIGLDIFEHIPDDEAAFRESLRVLAPGGILVLSVPAFMSLWGPHDIALMHHRRYTRQEVADKLVKAGFTVRRASYSIFFLYPVVRIVRFFEKRRKGEAKANLVAVPEWANRLLIGLQKLEARIIDRVNLPWGSSVIVVAEKPLS